MMDPAQGGPHFTDLSQELLCQIIKHLTVREALSLSLLCRKLHDAVELHFRICKVLDFGSRNVITYLPCRLNDESLHTFLAKCPQVEYIYGFNPRLLEQRRLRGGGCLTLRGIIDAFSSCKNLKGVNTACVRLMEAILNQLPKVTILGHFSNKTNDEQTPLPLKRISLPTNPMIGSLTLTGVDIPELTAMPEVEYLALQFVRFTKQNPFKNFSAPNLKVCILSHITGPSVASRYQTFFLALGEAVNLHHLELVHVPLLSGTIRAATAEHRRQGGRGFRKLKTLCISNCTELHDMDFGSLAIMSMFNLESLAMQATFTKNTFFAALHVACSALDSSYAKVHTLRLGYMGNAGYGGPIGRHPLEVEGSRIAENAYLQALASDAGMQNAVKLFPNVTTLYVGNSPHVRNPNTWKEEGKQNWRLIRNLTLKRCDGLRTHVVSSYITELQHLTVLLLEDLFPEVPVTDPRVGLGKSSQTGGFQFNNSAPNQSAFGSYGVGSPLRTYGLPTRQRTPDNVSHQGDNEDANMAQVLNSFSESSEQASNDDGAERNEPDGDHEDRISQILDLDAPSSSKYGQAEASTSFADEVTGLRDESSKQDIDDLAVPGPSGQQDVLKNMDHDEFVGEHSDEQECACAQKAREPCRRRNNSVGCQVTYVHCRCKFLDEDDSDDDMEESSGMSRHECESSCTRSEIPAPAVASSHKKMCDKSTTTNDPLLPKDPLQVFEVSSNSLVSVTINACGISDLIISHAPNLSHLEVLNCRILKTISLQDCPSLERIAVIDCLKFNMKSFVSEVLALRLASPCIVYLHPYVPKGYGDISDQSKKFSAKEILEAVFDRRMKTHHSSVLLDYCMPKTAWDDRGTYREAFLSWMKHLTAVNRKLTDDKIMPLAGQREFTIEWPVMKHKGLMPGRDDYKLFSDNPFLGRLWDRHTHNDIGLPTIESCGCASIDSCLAALHDDVQKWKTSRRKLFINNVGFYVYVPSGYRGMADSS